MLITENLYNGGIDVMNIDVLYEKTTEILNEFGRKESSLIAVLQAIQEEYAYLPREIFPFLSKEMDLPEAQISYRGSHS